MEWREALLLKFNLMKLTSLRIAGLPVVMLLAACAPADPGYTTVAVYPSRQQCGIDERMMSCPEVAVYLRDTLKLQPDRLVYVSAVSSDPLPKGDASLDSIAKSLADVGFKDVRTANFDLK